MATATKKKPARKAPAKPRPSRAKNTDPATVPECSLGRLTPSACVSKEKTRPMLTGGHLSSSVTNGVELMTSDAYKMAVALVHKPKRGLPKFDLWVPPATLKAIEKSDGKFTIVAVDGKPHARRSEDGSIWPLQEFDDEHRRTHPKPMNWRGLVPEFTEQREDEATNDAYFGFNHDVLTAALGFAKRWPGSLRLQYPKKPIVPARIDMWESGPTGHLLVVMPCRLPGTNSFRADWPAPDEEAASAAPAVGEEGTHAR